MNQMNKLRWALIAASFLSGSALAVTINCDVTPRTSVIADGQTLQLTATCIDPRADFPTSPGTYPLSSISLMMGTANVSGSVDTASHADGEPVTFTTPVGLAVDGATFKVTGVPKTDGDTVSSTIAKVVVRSATGSAVAAPAGFATTTAQPASCGTADGGTFSSFPAATACATGSTSSLVVTGPTSFSWSCLSTTGGAEASCYAARGVTYTVTATDNSSPNGNVSPTSQQVAGGSSAIVTATPNPTYNTSWSSTCGGTPNGNSFTTGAVNANCTVVASFTTAPAAVNGSCGSSSGQTFSVTPTANLCSAGTPSSVTTGTSTYSWSCAGSNGGTTASCSATRTTTAPPPPTGDDPGVGSGLWVPAGMADRTVADPSGPAGPRIVSYVPGCLNGLIANNSATGCAANSSYTGTLAGTTTSHTVSLGSGKQLVLRYRPVAGAGTSIKGIYLSSATGSSVGTSVRIWLSTDPTATYASVSAACKNTSSSFPSVTTGPGYCPLSANTPVYYFGIEYDSSTPMRFKVQESQADLY